MIAADSIDFANLTGVGIGAVLLALVFRTLWRQEGGWRAVLDSSRTDAKQARDDAKQAREDAAAARADAAAARTECREARANERECHRQLAQVRTEIGELRASSSSNTRRLDVIDATPSGEVPQIDVPGA